MISYNSDFLKVIKDDPIKRVQTLQKMIDDKYDTKAYEYYNLGLSYAQIYDYNNAYKYFKKAYNLDHGNKLYSVMTLITTKKFNVNEDKVFLEFLEKNILSQKGTYDYLAKYMYKIFIDTSIKLEKNKLSTKQKKSIFFRALYFIENIKDNGILKTSPLLVEYGKDPLVHLFNLIAKNENENEYLYISRIQDELPKIYNNIFLKESLVITDYYISVLRALGIFNRTDFNIESNKTPSYLRTKAIIQLYNGNPSESIKIIEYLHNEYNLQSIDSFYILIAALFSSGKDELAYATLTEIEFLYKDKDAKFLSGIRLLQDMKLNSAPQYFRDKLKGKLIDIRLKNFDNFLEEL
jgi:tetratricopeptide (TPR) repeat protein